VRFGVREHAMAGICNGLFAYGAMRPFCATFLNFAGYALGSLRLSALSNFGVIYICTHDSIGQGEDGPTHQPVEMLESLRSMPNVNVIRPCDGNETSAAYQIALEQSSTPSVLALSRQGCPIVAGSSKAGALKGGYVVSDTDGSGPVRIILAATGSEVKLASDSAKLLAAAGIKTRVVSLPCTRIFDQQSEDYKKSVWLNGDVPVLSVEASAVDGWHKYSHAQIGMTRFGASGKGNAIFAKFGFTTDNVVKQASVVVDYYSKVAVPNLLNRPKFENFITGH
jgi:transketolase